ncbi:anthranilate phosphoribosyltransferase [Shewanella submarina]|uniref:Anthranilate phosphoribosyltransferase n=1 Tax=Shewanella submarina TaxID=2016376 RepID=A0ABV7GHT6_9GAMM|nr:anthranilate phosphoribosyltransferase [Shewanella submarina]MCL1037763.1 anthranilate phosphoribosyltransferase [Shewanella submarina]
MAQSQQSLFEQKALLEQLYQGQSLTKAESQSLFSSLIQGEMSQANIAAMLIALKMRGETIDEITGAASALRAAARPFPKTDEVSGIIDIVGTGGDGYNTINISTTASFVAAASGAKVAKHGNRSVSSKSGSSDLLAKFGIDLTMSPETAAKCLQELGLCFLFAPHYHAGVKHAVPVRQELKTRTLFNILGPLINPASPDFMLLGVYTNELLVPIAETLKALGVSRAMVVHGSGLDEVALHGETTVVELKNGKLCQYTLTPADFGVESAEIKDLEGGEPEENAAITQAILQGNGEQAHTNAVAINAGCALYLSGLAPCVKTGTAQALATLESGKAWSLLQELANIDDNTKATIAQEKQA